MTRKWPLAKAMFSIKFSLAEGIRSRKLEPHTPVEKVFETCHIYHRNIFVNDIGVLIR